MFTEINARAMPGVVSVISVAVSTDNTIVWYDHWEDGYDTDVTKSSSTKTEIWGDGNAKNGCAPEVDPCTDAVDRLKAGNAFVIQNVVALPRDPNVFFYDGGDRIQASLPIAVTRGAYPVKPGSLMAGAVEVLATDRWGKVFESPVGMDVGKSSLPAFEYSALFFMAKDDETTVTLPNNTQVILNCGQGSMVKVNQRDRLIADKNIQVALITGGIDSEYELRWFVLYAAEQYSNEYISPVGDSFATTKVYLYNPSAKSIDVSVDFLVSGKRTNVTKKVSTRRGLLSDVIPTDSGAIFKSTEKFIALSFTDTEFTAANGQQTGGQWYDWGFPLVPRNQLTPQVLVGWG